MSDDPYFDKTSHVRPLVSDHAIKLICATLIVLFVITSVVTGIVCMGIWCPDTLFNCGAGIFFGVFFMLAFSGVVSVEIITSK
jgi:hypothetical protein